MKQEWRKNEKEIYLPKTKPTIVELSEMNYITIEGKGNPGDEEFSRSVQALYSLSYPIKMQLKGKGNDDYTVYPLEGFWSFDELGKELYLGGAPVTELKDYLVYKVMIRQPDFVTEQFYNEVRDSVFSKKNDEYVFKTRFETIGEGLVCQMVHVGSYDDEPASFELMEKYCIENGYKRVSKDHKEIYISNPQRVAPEKLKTTIRFSIIEGV